MLNALGKIRVRLVLCFAVAFASMALFGAISYHYFAQMERKLFFLSSADSLLNTVLEVRRYEKNYLLYHHEEDFQQALIYLGQFEQLMTSSRDHIHQSAGSGAYQRLRSLATTYRQTLSRLHRQLSGRGGPAAAGTGLPPREALTGELRAAGKELILRAEELAGKERQEMQGLLRDYQPLLVVFLVCLGAIGVAVVYLLLARLVRPLQTIEEATRVVAQGDFRPIPWADRSDEIGTLVQAFNRMVVQLHHNSEQMIQTEKLTALGTLTSGVAHELNNPLNNISTSCQILQEEMAPSASSYHKELLATIEQQVAKARDIVGSLLEFARQREFRLRPEDLRSVVEEALKLVKGELPAEVEVVVKVPAGITLEVDKGHLVQALLNLIMNGIQAMEGGGRLTIRGGLDGESGEVVLEVIDTGVGIAPEVLPRIFDPFFTTKEVGRGTGLGLSLVYGIVERHQGHIQVESKPGRGARFTIRLPQKAE